MPDEYRILLSQRVANQLESIFEHIAADSPQNASKLIQEILTAIDNLKMFPKRPVVQNQPRSRHPIRSLPVGSYMIFFEVHEDQHLVKIVRVSHGAREPPKRFT